MPHPELRFNWRGFQAGSGVIQRTSAAGSISAGADCDTHQCISFHQMSLGVDDPSLVAIELECLHIDAGNQRKSHGYVPNGNWSPQYGPENSKYIAAFRARLIGKESIHYSMTYSCSVYATFVTSPHKHDHWGDFQANAPGWCGYTNDDLQQRVIDGWTVWISKLSVSIHPAD